MTAPTVTLEDAASELDEWADSIGMHVGDDVREGRVRSMAALVRAAAAAVEELRNIERASMNNFQDYHEFHAWARTRARYCLADFDEISKGGQP